MTLSASLHNEIRKLRSRTRRSSRIFAESVKTTPMGVHSNYRYVEPYPIYFRRGRGSRIWDTEGNEYIDFNMAFGSLVVGHAHPKIVETVTQVVSEGSILGFEYDQSYRLAKLVCNRFGLDSVKFSTTGAEATMHAIRFARAFTGRKKIVKFEGCYHGSHDGLLVSVKPSREKVGLESSPNQIPASKGLLEEVVANTLVAPFNELDGFETIIRKNRGEVAAIIVEPIPMNMGFVLPEKGFLAGLRKIADEHGCLLIFDEIKTCGKFYGGAAKQFRVRPDLMVLGKAIAGGYPLSVVGGRKEILEIVKPGEVAHAGTFNSNPISVSASIVALSEILTETAFNTLHTLGEELGRGCKDIVKDARLGAVVQWLGPSGCLMFSSRNVRNWRDFLSCSVAKWYMYYVAMINRGVIPCGTGADEQWTVSVQHTDDEISTYLETFSQILALLKETEGEMPIVEAI